MSGALAYDVVVIGAGVDGLTAASYLAMAGKRVLAVDSRTMPGGLCETNTFGSGFLYSRAAHALYALDPRVIDELKLARHGLRFATRDMALVGLRPDAKHVVLTRDAYATARHLAIHSEADAATWPRFRREWLALSRKLRGLWWRSDSRAAQLWHSDTRIERLRRLGVAAWLDAWLESDALKATLAFDGHAMSPLAAGSSLLLYWRAAQEMCGLQGAVALPRGGMQAVSDACAGAARSLGVELRMGVSVGDLCVDGEGNVRGVRLAGGETVAAPLVLSSLSRRKTLSFNGAREAIGFGAASALERHKPKVTMARVTLALDASPVFHGNVVPLGARFVIADRVESLASAHAAAYAGRLPQELTMEAIIASAAEPSLAPSGQHLVSVLVGPVPVALEGGWRTQKSALAARVVAALSHYATGLSRHLVGVEVLTPEDAGEGYGTDDAFGGEVCEKRLLADWRERVCTPISGLYLCGASAEPVGAVSGRAGRIAASFAFGMKP